MSSNSNIKSIAKIACFVALFAIFTLMLTACSYMGFLDLRGDVVNITLIHYDNPNVGLSHNILGLAIGTGRYQDFDDELVHILEHLDENQFEDFLAVVYGQSSFAGHVNGKPDSPDGLIVVVEYESGEFDVVSGSFTARFAADGSFEQYIAAWIGREDGRGISFEDVIQRYFETDITWFLRRVPPTIDDFSEFMWAEGFDIVRYCEEVADVPGIRRMARAYFPRNHSEFGNFIEFALYWGPVRTSDAFEAHRAEILDNIGRNHTIIEERIYNYRMIQVHTRGNVCRAERAGDVIISVRSVNEVYSEWIEDIFERLLSEHNIADYDNENITEIDTLEWIDLGVIRIPSILSYEEIGLHGSVLITGDILNSHTDVRVDNKMYVGPLKGDFEELADNAERFIFDDGHAGLFIESFDYGTMAWIREDGNLITFRHGGDMSIFTVNKEIILQIVRSLR